MVLVDGRRFVGSSVRVKRTAAKRTTKSRKLRVVAIGGSAGSLDALEAIVTRIPARCGAAVIIVTHRDPRAEELMPGILSSYAVMPVRVATDGERLRSDVIYVIPSAARASFADGRIALRSKGAHRRARAPTDIDALFAAVAAEYGGSAIAVVLSGMGSDGARGLAAVASRGGVGMAQSPESSEYDSMPRAAIATKKTTVVGTPEEIAAAIVEHLGGAPSPVVSSALPASKSDLDAVLRVLGAKTGHDFSHYKRNTVARRIERRMAVTHAPDLGRYRAVLEKDPHEAQLLLDDLLIGVTKFFRDPEAFEILAHEALPPLFSDRDADRPIRAWVAGCATGEEAYSLAIVLHEIAERRRDARAVGMQIYATDLDKDAIAFARQGIYPATIEADVSAERLARFFTREDGGYRVKKQIRESIVFATQNIISDPPFTRLDVLLCRNVLIYLDGELQKRILPLFLYALQPGAVLALGSSESLSDLAEYFEKIDVKWKIFRRTGRAGPIDTRFRFSVASSPAGAKRFAAAPSRDTFAQSIDRAIVDRFAPPIAVVDAKGDLLFSSQRIGAFFETPTGTATFNVLAMARFGLAGHLRVALREAEKKGARVEARGVRLERRGRKTTADVIVVPLREPPAVAGLFLVGIREEPAAPGRGKASKTSRKDVARLEGELRALLAEMDRSQGELHSTNEELQSTNEELQSTNEELTTSKEEMQSMNEELLTLNAELQAKNDALATVNDDMRNLLNASQIPTLFLDNDLRVKRFTADATRIGNLIPSDVGRPITDIRLNVEYRNLARDVAEVLATLVFKEVEVSGRDSTFVLRIHPYRTMDNVIDGVVMTFHDVTAQRVFARVEEQKRVAEALEVAIAHWPGFAYVEDARTTRTVAVSPSASEVLGCASDLLANATAEVWRAFRHAEDRGVIDAPFRLRIGDGSFVRYADERIVLTHDDTGRAALVLHVFREAVE